MKFRPTHQVLLALSCISMPEKVSIMVDSDKDSVVIVLKKDGQDNDITIVFENEFIKKSYASRLIYLISDAMREWKNVDLPKQEKRGKLVQSGIPQPRQNSSQFRKR